MSPAGEHREGQPSREILRTYLHAWNADTDDRQELLDQACAPQLQYRDSRVELTGTPALAAYIATLHAHLPGARLELAGPVHDRGGELDYDWRVLDADGTEHSRGHDHTLLDPNGLILDIDGR